MQIEKVFNNNVIQATDEQGREIILMGRGLAFQMKVGQDVDQTKVEKTFVLKDGAESFQTLYQEMSKDEINCVLEIIKLAEDDLGQTFESSLYITLGDHIKFAIERTQDNIHLQNPLSWEVKKFYSKEYAIGQKALVIIKERMGLELAQDEAASIALHLINAQKESGLMEETVKMIKIVQDILNIVHIHFNREFDESSISYNRFMTHLQYFAQRVIRGTLVGTNDSFLFEQVQASYPEAFKCSNRIKTYIEQSYEYPMGNDEQVYLTIHIQRLLTTK